MISPPKLITENRERQLQYVKAGTIHKEMSLASPVFTFAVRELFLLPSNPFNLVKKPIKPPARKNRISQDQIKMVLVGLDNYEEGEAITLKFSKMGITSLGSYV